MGSDGMYMEYIEKPFNGYCPFCLDKNQWTGCRAIFKRVRYRCNACGAEVVVKMEDVLSGNYKTSKILIDKVGKCSKIYKFYELRRITFQEFYEKSILGHHYQRVRHIPGQGFPSSCRLCKFGQNIEDGESTDCGKYGFIGGADWICDSFVDGLAEDIDMYLEAVYKDK